MSESLAWRASPPCEGEGNASDVERAEDQLVVLGEPLWKINVEVVAPIVRVPGRHRRQRTAPPVENQNGRLASHDSGKPPGHAVLTAPRGHWNREDAPSEERPHDRVRHLDGLQGGGRPLFRQPLS